MVRENLLETLGQYSAARMISRAVYPDDAKLLKNAKVFS
jgi:hypothetical protein